MLPVHIYIVVFRHELLIFNCGVCVIRCSYSWWQCFPILCLWHSIV